jgi:hypothetical protein
MAKRRISMILIKDGKRYPVSHMTARERKAILRKHTNELGYLALAWNQLHHNLSAIFAIMLHALDFRAAQAIWHATDNDFTQRKMLRALVSLEAARPIAQLPVSPIRRFLTKEQCGEVLWILNQIDEDLRHKRNNAIHAPLMLVRGIKDDAVWTGVEAHYNPHNPRARPLRGKDIVAEFKGYGEQAERLAGYASAIYRVMRTLTAPWPDRPRKPQARKKKRTNRRVSGQLS